MQLSPDTLSELIRLIHQWTGLALSSDKAYLVRHRLAPVVRSCGFTGFDDLLLRLKSDGTSRIQDAVIEAITTKETSFFRDPWLFDALREHVLAALGTNRTSRLRIWSAGTSTGQEAWSVAMVVREFLDSARSGLTDSHFSILASDISAEAIDAARSGIYSTTEVERGLPEPKCRRFLTRHGDGWIINEPLRRLVQFRTFNLLKPASELGPFDLVLCRNVLIYFDDATRTQVCRSIFGALKEGGWLTIGSAESLHGISADFQPVKFGRAIIYRKSAPA